MKICTFENLNFDVKIMKFFRFAALFLLLSLGAQSCNNNPGNHWDVEIKNPVKNISFVDISKDLYDTKISTVDFHEKYPWFQGTVEDDEFELRRKDDEEITIYNQAISKIDKVKLKADLEDLFSHIKYYFPNFQAPKVFLFSSVLQGVRQPLFHDKEENLLFIDVTAFMGENNENYKGMPQYFQKSMNPSNIVSKVSALYAEEFVSPVLTNQKFLDIIVYHGKLMTLQDAFIPKEPDFLKINYTADQYDWALANEVNIWDFFVEENILYSDDPRLVERFIIPAPFSKFYTAVDNESSPQVGIFAGWQICSKYIASHPDVKLQDFLKMDAQTLFTESQYKPKATE